MKTLLVAVAVLLALHFLAVLGLVGYLGATGRLSRDRLHEVVDVFRLTNAQARQQAQQAAELAATAREKAQAVARLSSTAASPHTLEGRLAMQQVGDDLAMHRLERLQRDTADLRREMEQAKAIVTKGKAALDAERAQFKAFLAAQSKRQLDQDFKQTVRMYEQLKPTQTKQMFQTLMANGKTEEVVQYLAAMQLRKAGKVIAQFKTPSEIQQATHLLELLRQRGIYLSPPRGPVVAQGNSTP